MTQLMTLSISAEKLHEETIKDTLSMYLVIFVKQKCHYHGQVQVRRVCANEILLTSRSP